VIKAERTKIFIVFCLAFTTSMSSNNSSCWDNKVFRVDPPQPILERNGFRTHAPPVKVTLGVPKFGTLFHHFLYKHDFIGKNSNMKLLGDEPLENLDTWIEYFLV
jgi:hypothetical protein